jgi:hypothetical protein
LDVQLQPDAAIGYIEWTMVFRNDHPSQREARAQVLLPPGGVVSRVVLWIDDEPREAAFAGAGRVREAYKKVAVQQRRDPLLVTWAGPDRVMLQCFPVPPQGEMKICLGIAAPLHPAGDDAEVFRLPCFTERNFNIPRQQVHSLWIESDRPFKAKPKCLLPAEGSRPVEAAQLSGRSAKEPADSSSAADGNRDGKNGRAKYALRGTLSDDELTSSECAVSASRSEKPETPWVPDPKHPAKIIRQHSAAETARPKRHIVLVIDGSAGMREYFTPISEAIADVSPETEIRVLVAADEVIDLSDALKDRSAGKSSVLAEQLRKRAGVGGCDNLPALLHAFEEVSRGGKTVVWIHAAQPVLLQPATPLVQWMERGSPITLYDFAVAGGPNRLLEAFRTVPGIRSVPRLGPATDDLKGLMMRLTGRTKQRRQERSCEERQPPSSPATLPQLAQLWAADQVDAILQSGKADDRVQAVKLASAYRIVTPVSGAVVLENRQQYQDTKLDAPDPESLPAVPEPETWMLLLAALPGGLWWWERRRRLKKQTKKP